MRAVKGGMRQNPLRLTLSLALFFCLAGIAGITAGCSGNIEVYPYNKEQTELSEQGGGYWNERPYSTPRPTPMPSPTPSPVPTPEPTPTPLPVLTRDEAWKIPDPYGYQDETGTPYKDYLYRDLCGDYPVPDTVEVELTSEKRQALDEFFAARPELVERIGTNNFSPFCRDRVLLMDLTGDGEAEILIPYSPLENAFVRAVGGRIEVYELSSGRYLGMLYTSAFPDGNRTDWDFGGWYCDANGETDFYLLGYQWFRSGDSTGLSSGVCHDSHILWRVEYDGQALQSVPLWFYDSANWPAGLVPTEYHISIVSPDPEEMAAFSCDPYGEYDHVYDLAEQGADPVIPQILRQLHPVRTEYAVYEYHFPPAVRPEWGGATNSPPRYWGQSDSIPQTSLPLGLQIGYYLFGCKSDNNPPPKPIADRLDDPLPEEAPEPADGSPFVEWQFEWKQTQEDDGSLTYYRVQEILFRTPLRDHTNLAYLLWQAVPEGEGWRLAPAWLYVMAPESDITAKNGVDLRDFTVLRPSLEDAAAFALDPAGQYDAMRRRGTAGADPSIYEIVARLRPVGSE